MPRTPFPFTGGGGGPDLGAIPNTFADIAARNTQAASDATWLATYDADRNSFVRVGSGTSFDYYRRPITPTGTDDWELVNFIVTGPPGMGALPGGFPDGRVVIGESGAPVAGPLRSIGGNWEADQSLSFMGGNIDLTNFNIQSNGPMVTGRDTISDQVFLFPSRQLTSDASADLEIDRPAARTSAPFQSRNDETITTSMEIAFTFDELTSAYIDQYTIASGGSGKFYVIVHRGTSASDPIEYQTHTQTQIDDEDVFDASNTTISIVTNPLFLVQGQSYFFRLIKVGAADLSIGGTTITQADVDDPTNGFTVVGEKVPQFTTRFWSITQDKVLTETDIPQSEQDRLAALTTVGNPATDGLFLSSLADGTLSWATPPGTAADFFDSVVPRRLNTDLTFTAGTLQPGVLIDFEATVTGNQTVTVPPATSDDNLGKRWGVNNTKISGVLTLQGDGTAGHTFILEGGSFPFRLESGRFYEIVCVDRGTNTTSYRVIELTQFGGDPIAVTDFGGSGDFVITPSAATSQQLDLSNTGTGDSYNVTLSGVGSVQNFRGHTVTINNTEATKSANLSIGGNLLFEGTNSQRLIIPPNSSMSFNWQNDGGSPVILPMQPVDYEFTIRTNDITSSTGENVNWLDLPPILDHLIYTPAPGQANAGSLITRPGVSCQVDFRLEWLGGWGGITGNFSDGTTVTVQPRINNVNDSMGREIVYTQFHRSGAPVSHSRSFSGFMTPGQMLALRTLNLEATGPRMIEVQAVVRLRLKMT